VAPSPEDVSEPAEPETRALLEAYINGLPERRPGRAGAGAAQGRGAGAVGSLTWFSGRDTCMRYVSRFFGAPGDWQDGGHGRQRAARRGRVPARADGVHRAFGLAVLTVTATGIARIVVFGDPGLVTRFGSRLFSDGGNTAIT
jgi:hypothetical protein